MSKVSEAVKSGEVELKENYIMVTIPDNTVGLTLTAKIIDDDDEVYTVSKKMSFKEVQTARKDFIENIGDDFDARYFVTEEGKAWLEAQEKKK